MGRIITLSGRLGSGKSELAQMCLNHGFERMYFACPLKNMVKDFFNLESVEQLNLLKTKKMGTSGTDKKAIEFFTERLYPLCTEEEITKRLEVVNEDFTMRDWLQFIGTDLIRSYDPDWHIKKTFAMMDPNKNYVFDDTRFPNEIEALIEKGAEAWYVVRNKTDNISNHESETMISLESPYFDNGNIIPNDTVLDIFRNMWEDYLTNGFIRVHWQEARERFVKFKSDFIREVKSEAENCIVKPSDNGSYMILVNKDNGNTKYEFDLFRIELLKKYVNS